MSRDDVIDVRNFVEARMSGFDVALVTPADAAEMRQHFTAIKRRVEAAELACAKRVADTSLIRSRADRVGARTTGRQLGVSDGQAAGLLQLAERLEAHPATREAFEAGRISREQAEEITRTAEVRPDAESDLLAVAPRASLGELKRRAQRLRAAGADGEVAPRSSCG